MILNYTISTRVIEIKDHPPLVDGWYIEVISGIDGDGFTKSTEVIGPLPDDPYLMEYLINDILHSREICINQSVEYLKKQMEKRNEKPA